MTCLLGLDVGTTGCKAVLLTPEGQVLFTVVSEYDLHTPRPGWAEQNPSDWWDATVHCIRDMLATTAVKPGDILAVGLTGQMHGLVLLDAKGDVLRPCIMWNDQRTAQQCAEITERVGLKRLVRITGKPALTGFTAGKILWVRENEPEVYSRVASIQLPKDYARYRLTGSLLMDVADGSGTNLMDVGKRRWSGEIARALDIPPRWLPELHECADVCCSVSDEAARLTGLKAGTPVVAGAGDQAAQSIGTGIVGPGTISVTIGTSGVVFAATDSYAPDPQGRLHAYCHAAPGKWHLMGVTLAAGGSLRWIRDALCAEEKAEARRTGQDAYDVMTRIAAGIAAGADGVLFLPYLTGERTPHPDPNARGVFYGLSLGTTKAHLVRAVLEGVTFSLRECLELLCELDVCFARIRVSGGGARSEFWHQLMADVFNFEVVEVNVTQGASYGAALLAGIGVGVYADAEQACLRTIREIGVTRPAADREKYDLLYERYRELYPALKERFAADGGAVAARTRDSNTKTQRHEDTREE